MRPSTMKLLSILTGVLLPFTSFAAASAGASASASASQNNNSNNNSPAAIVTLRIPASNAIPSPFTLSPSTHATLSTKGRTHTAWLSTSNTFIFRDLAPGSYLVDFYCVTHAFAPLRLDVGSTGSVKVWETYRGNDWANKGEAIQGTGEAGVFDIRVLGTKGYFMERAKFNFFSILRNPMVLLGLVSMGIFIGMPYLVDNMDPEMRAEWEERQKSNPMNNIMGAATGGGGAGSNFDMAAFLAGSSKKEGDNGAFTTTGSETLGNGGGKAAKRGKNGR
ncbi:ER membrane protein complex subunit 7 [Rhypophila sp. PSN 637]